jgi:hypothetical protein
VQAAERVEHLVREVQRAAITQSVTEYQREQLVVSQPVRAETLEFLSRAIRCWESFQCTYNSAMRRALVTIAALLLVACTEPPNREIDQAQGAIDAARAAGADQYAVGEFGAATTALDRARAAVEARDYRLALNHALDARERAKEAARQAATRKAAVRSEAERQLVVATTALRGAEDRLKAAGNARVSAREVATLRKELQTADQALQKARAALGRDDYLGAQSLIINATNEIRGTSGRIEEVAKTRPGRRRR